MIYILLPVLQLLIFGPLLFLAGCSTVGTFHNPACIIFCQNNGGDTITQTKENQIEIPRKTDPRPAVGSGG